MTRSIALKNPSKCRQCNFCSEVACSSRYAGYSEDCTGCGTCSIACPYDAIEMVERENGRSVSIRVNGEGFSVPERITIKKALELCGYKLCKFPGEGGIFAPCETGGCWSTADYLDELVEAGMTDIGIDLKSFELDTFVHITGITEKELAKKYLDTAWDAVKYLIDNHADRVFAGIGIPYNRNLISLEEIRKMGEKIREMDEKVQVCVLDYRPAFRRMEIKRPAYEEMVEVWKLLTGTGLKTVICQTPKGHIGPEL